jgi:chemotaxis methyl-accepting protein methylase
MPAFIGKTMDKAILKIVEELAREVVGSSLNYRYDICTCPRCKNDIINHIVAKVSASSVHLDSENTEEIKSFYQREVNRTILLAIEYVGDHPRHIDPENRKKIFSELLRKISVERGLDLRNYHTDILKRRIALRLQYNNIPSYSKYIEFLTRNPGEFDRLFETLCINISEFFRDTPVWVTIQYLFENLISNKIKNKQNSIKLWSAGCANGEEPYSLAIALKEALRGIPQITRIEIIATDVDKACLNFAQKAVYSKENLKNVSPKLLARYFELSEGKFRIKDEVKSLVSFDYLDLTSQQYPQNIDVLTCRNVFIYFNRQLQKQILDKFCGCLISGGYLIMGKSESLGAEYEHCLEAIDTNARIFRKFIKPRP